jgi:PAS domain S-box-containing protein
MVRSGFALHLGRAGETDLRKLGRLRSRSKQYSSYLFHSLTHAGTAALGTIENRPELFDDAEMIARLHEALSISGVGVWSWDLGTEVIAADPVARRLWGLPERGRILTSHVLKAVHPDDVSAVRSAVLSAQLPGLCDVEFRLRRLDHEIRWVRVRGSISRISSKTYAAGVTIDVTDRKRAEEALTTTEARLKRAQELGGALAFEWDARTDTVVASPAFNALFGLDANEPFEVKRFLALVHPEDRMRVEEDQYRLLASPGPYQSEYRIILPDGAVRWILSRGESVLGEAGVPTGIAGIVIDITRRKGVEDDLRRSRREARARFRELKALYQNAPVGLALLDRDLRFMRINAFLAEINGLPVEAHIGRHLFDIVPDVRDVLAPLFRIVLEGGKPLRNIEVEGASPRQPAIRISWKAHFYPLKDDQGAVTGVGIVAEDVSAAKRAEHARDLLSRELSHRIKNLFAVVSSLIRLSAQGNPTAQLFSKTIRGRIEALGRAHAYIRPHEGGPGFEADESRTLHTLLETVLEPYRHGQAGERIRINGFDPAIGPGAATAFALACHEFATNAVKYGALSTPEGLVVIECRAEGDAFVLVWMERGGPPINPPPEREGFGSMLARRSVAGDLGGTIALDWAREGLTIRLSAPVERLTR